MSNVFLDDFISADDLASRWRVNVKTITRLIERNVLPSPVELPGKGTKKFFTAASIRKLEDDYRGTGRSEIPNAEEVLQRRDREQAIWHEFGEHVSPLDQFHDALEIAVASKLAANADFDLETLLIEKRKEYKQLLHSLEEKAKRDAGDPYLKKLVESRPAQSSGVGAAPELAKMYGTKGA